MTYDYGVLNRLVSKDTGEELLTVSYTYNSNGNLIRAERANREPRIAYDGMSQLIKSEEREEGRPTAATTYLYDPAGNRLQMEILADGEKLTVNYTYSEYENACKSQ